MKTYKITYQWGSDTLITEVKAENTEQARYLFYMQYAQMADIKKIEEVTE